MLFSGANTSNFALIGSSLPIIKYILKAERFEVLHRPAEVCRHLGSYMRVRAQRDEIAAHNAVSLKYFGIGNKVAKLQGQT